jgi:hypothetical protein
MKKSYAMAWVYVAIALLAGCAATPTVREEGRVSDASKFSSVQVIVDAPPNVKVVEGYAETSAELAKEFADAVKATGKFAAVGPNAAGSGVLEARLSIDELNYVHGGGRAVGGILAGRAILKVTMTLRDKASGAALGSVTADHQSSHLQGVFSPTTSRQVAAIAKELASKL